jgi:hypothetical protein
MADDKVVLETLLLGQSVQEQIKKTNSNFEKMEATADGISDRLALVEEAGYVTNDVEDLKNYTLKSKTGTDIELVFNDENSTDKDYKLTVRLKNINGTVVSEKTVDFPLEEFVVGAEYDDKSQSLILTLKNGKSVTVGISDIVSGLVPNSRTINGKSLSDDVVLTQDNIKAGETFTQFSKEQSTKLEGIEPNAQVNTITGVKGAEEEKFQTGEVIITKANIGLGNVENKSSAEILGELQDATTTSSGKMSAKDKEKLESIKKGAEANQNAFSKIAVGKDSIEAGAKEDTLNLVAGANVAINVSPATNTITISASGGTGGGEGGGGGKVQDVWVNGESVLDEISGIANINLKEIESDYVEVSANSDGEYYFWKQITFSDDTTYWAIVVKKTATEIGVFKSADFLEEIVAQKVVFTHTDGREYVGICIGEQKNNYILRTLNGQAVASKSGDTSDFEQDLNELKSDVAEHENRLDEQDTRISALEGKDCASEGYVDGEIDRSLKEYEQETLTTTNKTIVGAINEINTKIDLDKGTLEEVSSTDERWSTDDKSGQTHHILKLPLTAYIPKVFNLDGDEIITYITVDKDNYYIDVGTEKQDKYYIYKIGNLPTGDVEVGGMTEKDLEEYLNSNGYAPIPTGDFNTAIELVIGMNGFMTSQYNEGGYQLGQYAGEQISASDLICGMGENEPLKISDVYATKEDVATNAQAEVTKQFNKFNVYNAYCYDGNIERTLSEYLNSTFATYDQITEAVNATIASSTEIQNVANEAVTNALSTSDTLQGMVDSAIGNNAQLTTIVENVVNENKTHYITGDITLGTSTTPIVKFKAQVANVYGITNGALLKVLYEDNKRSIVTILQTKNDNEVISDGGKIYTNIIYNETYGYHLAGFKGQLGSIYFMFVEDEEHHIRNISIDGVKLS